MQPRRPGEIKRGRGRTFLPGVYCPCCMGGNCYRVGHVISNCECFCIPKERVTKEQAERYLALAQQGKRDFIRAEEEFQQRKHLGQSQIPQEVDSVNRKEDLGGQCRRFVNDGSKRCRVEYGVCQLAECGGCYQKSEQWRNGEPFVDPHTQLLFVREFFQHVVSKSVLNLLTKDEGISGVQGATVAVATVETRDGKRRAKKGKGKEWTIPSGALVKPGPEEEWFGCQQDFPTDRRVERREWDLSIPVGKEQEEWILRVGIKVGKELGPKEREQVLRLLWIWRDVFVDDMAQLPATDLVTHTIPTYPGARAHRARDPIYAKDEVRWQTSVLPTMIGTIVDRGSSPWVAKTTWVSKKDTTVGELGRWPLRMVHTYCPLNDVTIKTNYPMKRMEPILDDLADPQHRYFFSADAAHGFYAVPIYRPHAYKTAFNTLLGQFYYLRMPMGLTGAPATYARLKDLTFGPIPEPRGEPAALPPEEVVFKYFCDDDYGASHSFLPLLSFLHQTYFPRIRWARLTLKPSKSKFFVSSIEPLGMLVGRHQVGTDVRYGLRANDAKRGKIEGFPVPRCGKDIENFLYLTTYLKTLIPDRAELARVMKSAVIRGKISGTTEAETRTSKSVEIGFQWELKHQLAFEAIQDAIRSNVVVGGDPDKRYYLSVTAREHGFGAVLFQLSDIDELTFEGKFPKGKEKVVQFISQAFSDPETRYGELEREYLAVLRALEEVRFLVLQSPFPVTVYSGATMLLRKGDDLKGWIAGWHVRMSEFRIDPHNLTVKDLSLSLARIDQEDMPAAWTREREWEDVCAFDQVVENSNPSDDVITKDRIFIPMTEVVIYTSKRGLTIEPSTLLVYVDGACRGNGTPEVIASIGIYVGPDNPRSYGKLITSQDVQGMDLTNQTTELAALIHGVELGVELAREGHLNQLVVASDSAYACGGITTWVYRWRQTGYEGVHNAQLFRHLDQLLIITSDVDVRFWRISRDENAEADNLARKVIEEEENRIEGLRQRWREWLEDEWYGGVVAYILFQKTLGISERRLGKLKRDAKGFILVEEGDSVVGRGPQLAYRETNGDMAICIRRDQVGGILHRFHDNHSHFSTAIMSRNILGRYYWPGRLQDIAKWCLSCEACQRMGPRRKSAPVKTISSLQPMDLLGMDFLSPISPKSRNGSAYILLIVDYFSRYLFAHATTRSTGAAVVELVGRIAKIFGWPLAFYVDNGSHFVKGEFPGLLAKMGTILLTAPITNPRSVGLSERYVQLILAGLQTKIAAEAASDLQAMERWDEYLDPVVHSINTRVLKVHGYTPSQLFLGFNVHMHALDVTLVEELRREQMRRSPPDLGDIGTQEWDLRLACIEEIRELTRERVLLDQEEAELRAAIPRYLAPQQGDLVLRRRFQVDKSLGMKLHTKWDGPFRLSRIAKQGVSGDLEDLKTGRFVGRYAFEALKVFVPREINVEGSEGQLAGQRWVTLTEGLRHKPVVGRGAVVL